MGLLNVVLFPDKPTARFNYKIRKSWFPEGSVFVKVFPQKSNGSDCAPFCFVFLWSSGGSLVWECCFAASVLFRVTQGIGFGCTFFLDC